jgi:hypothetical protein
VTNCILYQSIFFYNLRCTSLDDTAFSNTVTPNPLVGSCTNFCSKLKFCIYLDDPYFFIILDARFRCYRVWDLLGSGTAPLRSSHRSHARWRVPSVTINPVQQLRFPFSLVFFLCTNLCYINYSTQLCETKSYLNVLNLLEISKIVFLKQCSCTSFLNETVE